MAKTRTELRQELDEMRAEVAKLGAVNYPIVIECIPAGNYGETRAPGVYFTDPARRTGPVVVFSGLEPPPEWLARFKPKGGPEPLIIVLGPQEVPLPLDGPHPE